MKDALVKAPAAIFYTGQQDPVQAAVQAEFTPPSPEEIIQAQSVEIRRLQSELRQLHITSGTIANCAVALVHVLSDTHDGDPREFRIDRALRLKLDGAKIQIRADANGDIFVSYVDAPSPVFDGRAADA